MGSDGSDNSYLSDLAARREPAMQTARALLERDEYEQAIDAVYAVDESIYADVALARLLEAHLVKLVSLNPRPDKMRLEAAFRQALSMYDGAYPDPHTAIEAENFDAGRAVDRARLVKILGYDPGK